MSTNDITNDRLISKPSTNAYRDGYELAFGKKEAPPEAEPIVIEKHKPMLATSALDAYQQAINRIDDYFEYINESAKDRAYVHSVLERLTTALKEL